MVEESSTYYKSDLDGERSGVGRLVRLDMVLNQWSPRNISGL